MSYKRHKCSALAEKAARALLAIEFNHSEGRAVLNAIMKKRVKSAPTAPAATGRTYRVKSDDTLRDIARAKYGDPSLWPRIFNANRERINDPNLIYPNQE
jgi:nucleoid-associated protein YgaU